MTYVKLYVKYIISIKQKDDLFYIFYIYDISSKPQEGGLPMPKFNAEYFLSIPAEQVGSAKLCGDMLKEKIGEDQVNQINERLENFLFNSGIDRNTATKRENLAADIFVTMYKGIVANNLGINERSNNIERINSQYLQVNGQPTQSEQVKPSLDIINRDM